MSKIEVTIAEDGAVTGTSKEQTVLEQTTEAVLLPLGITAEPNEYVQKSTAAMSVIGFSLVSGLVGEAYGHKRAREGKESFLPVMRG